MSKTIEAVEGQWSEVDRGHAAMFWSGAIAAFAAGVVGLYVSYANQMNNETSRATDSEILTISLVNAAFWAVAGLVVGIVAGALAEWPVSIARSRGHPSTEAIRACGWIGVFVWPAWIVAYVWAHSGTRQLPQTPVRRALANPDDTPGLFEVLGVDKETGMDTRVAIEAESGPNAKVKAELRGVVVTDVRRVPLKM